MDMFNSTSSDDDASVNNIFRFSVFFFIIVPTAVFSGLCVVAILLAKDINWPMRVLLLNIFAGEFSALAFKSLLFIGVDTKIITSDYSCRVVYNVLYTSTCVESSSVVLYSVMVYIFVKYSQNRLKWNILISFIAISWTGSVLFGLLTYTNGISTILDGSTCMLRPSFSPLYFPIVVLVWLFEIAGCVVLVTFSFLTYCYNTLEEDNQIKKAITKSLFYLIVRTILAAVTNIMPSIVPLIRERSPSSATTTQTLVIFYFIIIFTTLPSVLTPVVMIVALKPLRTALKQMKKTLLSCCKRNAVHPVDDDTQL